MQVCVRTKLWDTVYRACTQTTNVVDTIFQLVHVLSREDVQRFAALLWNLGKHKNFKLWQDVSETITQVADRAFQLMDD